MQLPRLIANLTGALVIAAMGLVALVTGGATLAVPVEWAPWVRLGGLVVAGGYLAMLPRLLQAHERAYRARRRAWRTMAVQRKPHRSGA